MHPDSTFSLNSDQWVKVTSNKTNATLFILEYLVVAYYYILHGIAYYVNNKGTALMLEWSMNLKKLILNEVIDTVHLWKAINEYKLLL